MQELFQTQKQLIVQFPQGFSGGINEGAEVRFAGTKVGVVASVDINVNHQVELMILVDEGISIKTNSKATIKTIGLLGGEKYLNLSTGSLEAPQLKPGDIIIGEQGLAMEELLHTVSKIAENTQGITAFVDKFLADGDRPGEFLITLHKTQQLLDRVNQTITGVNRMVNANEQNIRTMVEQVSHITGQISSLIEDNREKIDTTFVHVNAITEQIPRLLSDVRTLLVDVQGIAGRINRGEGTAARLITDDELLLQLQRLIDDTDSLINQVKTKGIRVRVF